MRLFNNFKRMIYLTIICFMAFQMSGCTQNEEALLQNKLVADILAEYGVKNSKITYLCDDSSNDFVDFYDYKTVEISDEELRKYVDDLLLSHEKMIEITDRNIVQTGDAIVVSYVVYYNSEIVANTSNDALIVGSGNYGEEFEKAVLGAVVGAPFSCELSSPVDTEKYKKGDILKYNITVKSINYFVSYTSSDQYILDYYDCETEAEFLAECKIQLKQIKEYENNLSSDNEFLNAVTGECKFYIDKEEAAVYSKKIVDEYKDLAYISGLSFGEYIKQTLQMTEDEFYDYCYDMGVKEIKQHLLIGASEMDTVLDNNQAFAEFCSMSGYNSNNDDYQAKYNCLKDWTISRFAHQVVDDIGYLVTFDERKMYTVDVYDSSNIQNIDFTAKKNYNVAGDVQQGIITTVKNITFGFTGYSSSNHLYDTVLIFKSDGKTETKLMIDNINGYVKYQTNNGDIVCAQLTEGLKSLIQEAKQG